MPYINIYFKNYMFLMRKDRKVNKYKRYNHIIRQVEYHVLGKRT